MSECCARCGGTFRIEKHHIISRAQGESDDPANLIQLCAVCHGEIHTGVTRADPARYTGTKFTE